MDTISRENNSYLPVAGVIAGVLALVLSVVALAKTSSLTTKVADHDDKLVKFEDVEKVARDASGKADKALSAASTVNLRVDDVVAKTSEGFKTYFTMLQDLKTAQEAKKPATGSTGPVVAGKDEYVVKQGDIGSTIAKATGFTTAQIAAVNPGLDWTKLKVNQKLKLPAKK